MSPAARVRRESSGFALVAVLWLAAVMSVLAMGYATTARLLAQEAIGVTERRRSDFLLRSAIELGVHEYRKYNANRALTRNSELIEDLTGEPLILWRPRFEPYAATIDGETVMIRIVARSGKLNINTVPERIVDEVLGACGVERGASRTALVNSIADWRDADSNFRVEGAESDYYEGLDEPYLAKNADLESIEELLLVKGVTPALYHGAEGLPGLSAFFGVEGREEKLDVNSADPATFALVPGMPPEVAEAVTAYRWQKPVEKIADLAEIIPFEYFSTFQEYFDVLQPGAIMIEAWTILPSGKPSGLLRQTLPAF